MLGNICFGGGEGFMPIFFSAATMFLGAALCSARFKYCKKDARFPGGGVLSKISDTGKEQECPL